jgi:hypothetical protein
VLANPFGFTAPARIADVWPTAKAASVTVTGGGTVT